MRGIERLWFSPDLTARALRAALTPLELLYAGVVTLRGKLYDAGVLTTRAAPIPAVSVGNLTVGGTGKTPISAWLARQLVKRGATPAVVLRGYGNDETLVHRLLNLDIVVVPSTDRAAGIEVAAERGCDVAVLDDAFQHRRAARAADVVLVSAERWSERRHLLPAGPWREPLSAIERASLVIVTRKSASADAALDVARRVERAEGGVRTAIVHLAPRELRSLPRATYDAPTGTMPAGRSVEGSEAASRHGSERRAGAPESHPLGTIRGRPILAISAIGDPRAFETQLAALGARVESRSFPDHHRFTAGEVARLSSTATELVREAGDGLPVALCTLKDAVKLASLWPREAPPLWYVSQQPEVESGRAELDALIAHTLAARHRQP
ncbi:MAG TPA: tetraacyldisaccharide 4'-kinase [Gemmatimonadaceae bacterium]|nr:tetraacyldisaccharide 4'-kinase [Gemmatimonadaceae bacterium]